MISVNWATYIWGVNNGRVVETSLGYFINPLVTVLMGVLILASGCGRCSGSRWAIATAAVVVLTLDYGRLPWVALVLAFSFGTYGLAKKTANVGAVESLTFETAVIAPFAAGLPRLARRHRRLATSPTTAPATRCCFMTTGIVTAIPLICFGAAATRVSMVTLGLLQYLAPVLQFALGVLVLPRGHARRPLGRLRAGLGRAGDVHRRGGQPPAAPAAAHRRGHRRVEPSGRPPDGRACARPTRSTRSGGAGGDDVGEGLEGGADRARRGATASERLGLGGPGDDVGAGLVHRRVLAEQVERLGVQGVVGEVAVEQLEQPGVGRVGRRPGPSAPAASGTPSRRSVPGVLPDSTESEAMSRMSSESWKAEPTISPYAVSASSTSREAPPKRAP